MSAGIDGDHAPLQFVTLAGGFVGAGSDVDDNQQDDEKSGRNNHTDFILRKPALLRAGHQVTIKIVHAVEHDLDSDTDQNERRQADEYARTRGAQQPLQFVREAVAQEDGQPNQQNANHSSQRTDDQLQMAFHVQVAAERQSNGDRARSDSQRHGERIKRPREYPLSAGLAIEFAVLQVVLAIQDAPAGNRHHQSAAHLHRRQAHPEELQDVRSDEQRGNQQHNAIDGNPHGDSTANAYVVALGHFGEDGRYAERVYDGQQRGEYQQHIAYDCIHALISIAQAQRLPHKQLQPIL